MSTTETEIPKTMLAWQKHFGSNEPVCVEVPVPTRAKDGLLVKIHAAGVCHSDHALLNSGPQPPGWQDKYTLGHEGCGEVVSVGSEVSDFAVGDMVAILAVAGCGASSCSECSNGVAQICNSGEHYGIGQDGSFAPYIAIKARAAAKLPAGVSPAAGAVATDAVLTAYHAVVDRAQASKGETVLLYGLGGLGFNALQILLHIGARVVVVDKRQAILDEAVRFGVKQEDVVPPETVSVAEWIRRKQLVVDKVIDFVGIPDSFRAALDCVRLAGTVVLVGLLDPNLSFHSLTPIRKHINILCSYGGTYSDLQASLDLIANSVITPQVETGSLADFPAVLSDLHADKIKSRIALVPEELY